MFYTIKKAGKELGRYNDRKSADVKFATAGPGAELYDSQDKLLSKPVAKAAAAKVSAATIAPVKVASAPRAKSTPQTARA